MKVSRKISRNRVGLMKKLGQRKPRAKTGGRENCGVEGISVIIQAQSPHILEIARPVGHLSSRSLSIYCE